MLYDSKDALVYDMFLGSRWLLCLAFMISQFQFGLATVYEIIFVAITCLYLSFETYLRLKSQLEILKRPLLGHFQLTIDLALLSVSIFLVPQVWYVVLPLLCCVILLYPFANSHLKALNAGLLCTFFYVTMLTAIPEHTLANKLIPLFQSAFILIFSILVAEINKLHQILFEKNKHALNEIYYKNELLEKSAKTDFLTDMYNHQTFYAALEDVSAHHAPIVLILLDIDNFKQINDQCGHVVGDFVIREVAGLIKRQIRSSDIAARYGGEEFAVLLPRANYEEGVLIAERIRNAIASHQFCYEDTALGVTVSGGVGISTVSLNKSEQSKFVDAVDELLYVSKRSGKNRITTQSSSSDLCLC